MVQVYAFKEKNEHLFTSKRNRYLILGSLFLLGLVIFFLFKGCHFNYVFEKEYYIGQDSRWHGVNLMGKERNLSAFNNNLLASIAREENFGIRILVTPASELLPELEREKLQGALTIVEPSYLYENRFIFSDPYFLTGPVLIIPSTAPLEGWNEKRKKIIGIQANSHALVTLEQDPSIQIKIYEDILTTLSDLSERRIDGALIPAIPAYTYVTTFYKNKLKIATLPLNQEGIRLVALKNEEGESLVNQFNQGLTALKKNGTYKKMLEQWGLVDTEDMKLE